MKRASKIRVAAALAAAFLGGCVQTADVGTPKLKLDFTAADNARVWGFLSFPDERAKNVPLIVLVHHTTGYNAAIRRWATWLREAGYATLELDYWSGRQLTNTSPNLPAPFMDIFAGMRAAGADPRIDHKRIGVLGQSRGANMALSAANYAAAYSDSIGDYALTAVVALYPSCQFQPQIRDGSKLLILIGDRDDYSPPGQCESVSAALGQKSRIVRFEGGVYHAFDDEAENRIAAGHAHRFDATALARSKEEALKFFRDIFGK